MRTLVIDCATEACSVALFEDEELLAGALEVIGRGHAERLVPMIAGLPGKGRADRVVVSLGPGSFTGVRIGLAAARALGLAWRADVLGYPTLALVAAMAQETDRRPVTVCMAGGHGEWFVQDFGADGLPEHELRSQKPEVALHDIHYSFAAGSRARELLRLDGAGMVSLDILPDARHFLALPPGLLTAELAPIYGRQPDARLPGRRHMIDDLDRIMAVMEAAFDPAFGEAWTRRQVSDSLVLPNTHYLLAGTDGRSPHEDEAASGFALSRGAADEEELLLIAVHPDHRGRGIGSALLERFIEAAHARGARRLFLEMREGNRAEGLYRRYGFESVGRRRHYYRRGSGSPLDAITFVREDSPNG